MSASYIGPAQVAEGATLQRMGGNMSDDKYQDVRSGVDVQRLRHLAAQNLLALFYYLNLFQREDQPLLMVWIKSKNLITEGIYFHGVQRQPDGDIKILFSHVKNGQSSFSAMLSDIKLAEVFYSETPGYVRERLSRPQGRPAIQSRERDKRMVGEEPDNYLRHPKTGEALLPFSHRTFFNYALGYEMPEPFTIMESARIVMGAPATQAA